MELKKDENNLILLLSEKFQYNYDNDIYGKKVKVDELKIENKETINLNDNVNVLTIENHEININEDVELNKNKENEKVESMKY